MQGMKMSATCNDKEGQTTSAKEQGTEIEYMHKAVKWREQV